MMDACDDFDPVEEKIAERPNPTRCKDLSRNIRQCGKGGEEEEVNEFLRSISVKFILVQRSGGGVGHINHFHGRML